MADEKKWCVFLTYCCGKQKTLRYDTYPEALVGFGKEIQDVGVCEAELYEHGNAAEPHACYFGPPIED